MSSTNIDYGFEVGDLVCHIKDRSLVGTVTEIDKNYDLGGVTTCKAVWGATSYKQAIECPKEKSDILFSNKILKSES